MNNLSSDPEEMENFYLIRSAYALMIKKFLSIKYSIRAIFAKKDSTNVLEPLNQSAENVLKLCGVNS